MSDKLTGRHVLFILVAMFGTVFAVNGVFAYFAISAFPGVDTRNAYRKGVSFNRQIAGADRLKALGWTLTTLRRGPDRLILRFEDKSGLPVTVQGVTARLFHPTNAGGDNKLPVMSLAPGEFSAVLLADAKGRRQLRVEAIGPAGMRIRFRRELWLD